MKSSVLGTTTDLSEAEIASLTNLMRTQAGLKTLKPNAQLSAAAKEKAEDMIKHQYWEHYSATGVSPWSFITNSGYSYHYAGENLAKGFQSSITLVNAWMHSPSHRNNILNPNYQDIGIYIATDVKLLGEKTTLIVQLLGSPSIDSIATIDSNFSSPPPLNSQSTPFEILSVKPLLSIFGTSGIIAFIATTTIIYLHDRKTAYYKPSKHLWGS